MAVLGGPEAVLGGPEQVPPGERMGSLLAVLFASWGQQQGVVIMARHAQASANLGLTWYSLRYLSSHG